ncbi:MAG: hypothetical protein MK291_02860 [Planctomycetes bacterium]|nr:hypothetical protein [Planctomycetota bacterium]
MAAGGLFIAALLMPAALQGPVAILDATPTPDSALEKDLEALLDGAAPLHIELGAEGATEIDREDKVILGHGDEESADARALSERVLEAPAIILEGGTLLAWYETLFKARRPTRLVHSLSRLSREGRPIIGVGRAGAVLAGGGIVKTADLKEVERNPKRTSELQARGVLGWGPPALVDADAWGGEDMRTARIMERSYMSAAAHLAPGSGLVLSPRREEVKVIGRGGVTLFETAPGHRNRRDLRKGSLSLLARGDVWDLSRGVLRPNSRAALRPKTSAAFNATLWRFAADPSAELSFESPWGRLLVRRREDTRFVGPEGALRPVSAEFDLFISP